MVRNKTSKSSGLLVGLTKNMLFLTILSFFVTTTKEWFAAQWRTSVPESLPPSSTLATLILTHHSVMMWSPKNCRAHTVQLYKDLCNLRFFSY